MEAFPKDSGFGPEFIWGAAAASYQIEGAAFEDGKGASVWDMFCQKEGAIFEGHSGATACDHYHRYSEDLDLMSGLGLNAYRLSLSWPRLIPEGIGAVNQKGVDFYDRLIDGLLERDIDPWITLFHWDYPLALFQRGGWLNRDSVEWFGEFAALVGDKFSDRVKNFFTLNEPQVFIGFGHMQGQHAPGLTLPLSQMLLAGHHSMMAHGKAVQALRQASSDLRIGYAPVGMPKLPVDESAESIEFARKVTFEVYEKNSWNNSWWMDPVLKGEYPEQGLEFFGADAPKIAAGDLELMHQQLDFFGVNIYQGGKVKPSDEARGFSLVEHGVGQPRTAFDWPVTPDALYWGPRFFAERYDLPIYVTENGLSCRDWVSLDGKVHDPARIDFTQRYLSSLLRGQREGIDIRGYFHWSIMDNFEWAAGYKERFGLLHVDYSTQKRTPKDSYFWYRALIASGGQLLF